MPNPKQYFLHALNLALLLVLLMLEVVLLSGYKVLLRYWVEYYIEFPILIAITIVCIANVISEMRKYLNG